MSQKSPAMPVITEYLPFYQQSLPGIFIRQAKSPSALYVDYRTDNIEYFVLGIFCTKR